MGYGLEINRSDGTLGFSPDMPNYVFDRIETVISTEADGADPFTIEGTADKPPMFFMCFDYPTPPGPGFLHPVITWTGAEWEVQLYLWPYALSSTNILAALPVGGDITIKVYIFKEKEEATLTGYGLSIHDSGSQGIDLTSDEEKSLIIKKRVYLDENYPNSLIADPPVDSSHGPIISLGEPTGEWAISFSHLHKGYDGLGSFFQQMRRIGSDGTTGWSYCSSLVGLLGTVPIYLDKTVSSNHVLSTHMGIWEGCDPYSDPGSSQYLTILAIDTDWYDQA
jgi:hypothetical protein